MAAMRRSLTLCLMAATLFCLTGFSGRPQVGTGDQDLQAHITQVDTSAFPTVTVYVSVANASGEPAGIEAERIVLFENGQPVEPVEIRGIGEGEALSTMLVIDVSGSMNLIGKLAAAQEAARAYVAQMRPGDQAGLIAFNTQVTLAQPLTADASALLTAIGRLRASDDTALYDAVAEAVEALEGIGGRKAIIVLSDGLDNSSQLTPGQVLGAIGPGGASISTIGLGDPSLAAGEWAGLDETALQFLASRAGGEYGYVEDADALRALYERLGRALQSEYVISYVSPSALRDGVSRSLSVGLVQAPPPTQPEASYNPGGLVPEVARPAPWTVFIGGLGILVLLLFAPTLILSAIRLLRERQAPSAPAQKPEPRIRLHEQGEPRIRLK